MGINICKALPKDAYEYAACHIACWRSAYKGIMSDEYLDTMSVEKMVERNRESLSEPGEFVFYYVEHNGRMIGRLIFGKSRDDDKPDAGEIAAMYLIDAFWNRGYGRKMMDFSITELQRMGYHEVVLWVLEDNNRARQFYEKCGFAFDGTKKEIDVDKPLVEMRYARSLSSTGL